MRHIHFVFLDQPLELAGIPELIPHADAFQRRRSSLAQELCHGATQAADDAVAAQSAGATYAGDADPYKKPHEDEDSE